MQSNACLFVNGQALRLKGVFEGRMRAELLIFAARRRNSYGKYERYDTLALLAHADARRGT